jgi:uncharacterized protein (TIGR02118 family)
MIIRSAVLEGSVTAENRVAFDHHMETTVLTAIARYPGIREVRLRRPVEQEAGAPPVYMVFDLWFETLVDMHAALASPIRQEVRARIGEVMTHFEGRVYHLVLEEGAPVKATV